VDRQQAAPGGIGPGDTLRQPGDHLGDAGPRAHDPEHVSDEGRLGLGAIAPSVTRREQRERQQDEERRARSFGEYDEHAGEDHVHRVDGKHAPGRQGPDHHERAGADAEGEVKPDQRVGQRGKAARLGRIDVDRGEGRNRQEDSGIGERAQPRSRNPT